MIPPRDVVFTFSFETWANAWRRGMYRPPDRLLTAMGDEPRIGQLLVANPPQAAFVEIVRPMLGRRLPPFVPPKPGARLVTPLRTRRTDPTRPSAIARSYRRYGRVLERYAQRAGLREPALVTFHPFVAAHAETHWARSVTYYARDDWTSHEDFRPWWPGLEDAYARMRTRRVRVCAVSQALLDRLAPVGPNVVVPNGIDPGEWTVPLPPPAWFADLPRPRLLYTGVLNWRLDIDGLIGLAARFPSGSVVLVGPIPDRGLLAPLEALPNVHIRPPVDRAAVVGIVFGSDLGIIAHRRSALTEAMSPLKLYEYLAAGKPVATPDLGPVHDIDPRVVLFREDGHLADAAESALALPPVDEAARLAFIHRNSWHCRHQLLFDLALA